MLFRSLTCAVNVASHVVHLASPSLPAKTPWTLRQVRLEHLFVLVDSQ